MRQIWHYQGDTVWREIYVVRVCACVYMCMCVCARAYVCECVNVYMCACVCIRAHVCVYVYKHTHTHTHINYFAISADPTSDDLLLDSLKLALFNVCVVKWSWLCCQSGCPHHVYMLDLRTW